MKIEKYFDRKLKKKTEKINARDTRNIDEMSSKQFAKKVTGRENCILQNDQVNGTMLAKS